MLYDYQCQICKREVEAINKIDERNTHAPVCCETHMQIIIKQAPMAYMDREVRYICPVTNKEVTTRRQRNEIMAREGLVDANDRAPSKQERIKAREQHKASLKPTAPKELEDVMGNIFKDEQQQFLDEMSKKPL